MMERKPRLTRWERRLRELRRAGFVVVRSRRHVVLRAPDGRLVTIAGTPSGSRVWANELARLRRMAGGRARLDGGGRRGRRRRLEA